MALKKQNMKFIFAGLMLGTLTASMDSTIVATAMASIISDLGGFDKLMWVTSAYMVAEIAGMPIFGKLSDIFGRKRFFIFGLVLFMLGSILCGMAQSMEQLILFRVIQGIGGGALAPISLTIMFDIISLEQRGKIGAMLGTVYGLATVAGPLIGAFITDWLDWRSVFWINIPLGLAALILVAKFYRESPFHEKEPIDWQGSILFVAAIGCFMVALEMGGHLYPWNSPLILTLFGCFAVLFAAFLYVERKVPAPILSFSMFGKKLFAMSNIAAFLSGTSFIVLTVYIPIFVQGGMGGSVVNSGLVLLPMMLATIISGQVSGYLTKLTSYRNIMFGFTLIFIAGVALLAASDAHTPQMLLILYMFIAGFGIGASFSVLSLAGVHHFGVRQSGAANSSLSFFRLFGMTVGVSLFGVIQRHLFAERMEESANVPQHLLDDPRGLLNPEARQSIPAEQLETAVKALTDSISQIFLWDIVPAALALLAIGMMGNERLIEAKARRANKKTPR
ncbi:MDR family MFS transporter [Paenibacillus thailandensis]|uniref:MDR family MFS transporter n=1 Tax=Paenibacillus thailandensis TaxID=393250 RepID=A0ABW5R433_9BACL